MENETTWKETALNVVKSAAKDTNESDMLVNIVKAFTDDHVLDLMSNEEVEKAFEDEDADVPFDQIDFMSSMDGWSEDFRVKIYNFIV